MSADNAVEKIHKFEKFGSVLGLERMRSLMDLLGNPQDKLRFIHVAGTNGKGSVCKYIYEALESQGYKTGLYTSPFLVVFNERIEFDHKYISDMELEAYTDRVIEAVKVMISRGEDSPTEFELITAIAFLYFYEKGADFVVLEVGLGGIGDATNIIEKPLCSVIASISFDHTEILGDTIWEIATNKAGIIKKDCPVVTSAKDDEAIDVFREVAATFHSQLFETRNAEYKLNYSGLAGQSFDTKIMDKDYKGLVLNMLGKHQIENAILALTALDVMRNNGSLVLSDRSIYEGFKCAKQIARFEVIDEKIILDGAHNPDGAKSLLNTVQQNLAGKRVLMVLGILKDKDVDTVLESFKMIASDFAVTEPVSPRKMDIHTLEKKLISLGSNVIYKDSDYKSVCDFVLKKKDEYDVVLFAGSLYLVGAVKGYLLKN